MAVIFKRVWIIHLLLHFRWSKLGSGLQTCHLGKSGILYWMGNKNGGKAKIQLQTCQQKGMPYFDSRWIWYCDCWWKRISWCSIANMYPRVRFFYNFSLWKVFGWSLGGFFRSFGGLWQVFGRSWQVFGRSFAGLWQVFCRTLAGL